MPALLKRKATAIRAKDRKSKPPKGYAVEAIEG